MFNTEQEFLDAFLAFPGWETDPSVVQTIMTIVVDGVPFIVTGSMDTVPDMAALIASINDSEAGEFVVASVAQNAQTNDFYLAINARDPSVTSISVLNDQTLLFNRVTPPPDDGSINGDFITGTAAVEVFGSNPVVNDQIEPKNDGSVLERVYLPLHTRITSLYVDNIARVGELQLGGIIAPPASLVGYLADKKGAFRVSDAGIFYCTADYDGATEIWKTVPFGGGAVFRTIPPGVNPNTGVTTGGPADKIGELYVSDEGTILMCYATYNGTDEIWSPLSIPQTSGLSVTTYTDYTYDSTNADYWPDGAYLSQYYIVMSPSGGNTPADIVGGCFGKPGANSVITSFVAPRAMWITDTNVGAGLWRCRTAPSSQVLLNLQINGSNIGTIRFAAGNTYGTLWSSWGQRYMSAGDVFTVTAPATQDSTFADVYFSIIGGIQ